MKTSKILLLSLLFIGMSVQSQNIYIRAGLGVAVSTAANIEFNTTQSPDYTTNQVSTKKAGLGTGLPFVLAAGYKLSENFRVELGVDYFYGFSIKTKDIMQTSTFESKYHGQMLSIVPAIVMTFPVDKLHPYARLGLKLGVMNSVVFQEKRVQTILPDKATETTTESKIREYGGIAIGAQAAVGTDYAVNDKISIFGEIQLDGISYSPKHGKYLEYSQDGVDQMSSRTKNENNWNFLKDVDFTKNIPDDQPDEVPRINFRFGNVGLVVGVKYTL
jgi:hypothetical protein